MPDRTTLTASLYQQASFALAAAQQWMKAAQTTREREFANTAVRHARGLQVAAAAGQQDAGSSPQS